MMEPDTTQAIELIRQGNLIEGAKILSQVIKTNPEDETAWLWMSACVTDTDKKVYCLKKVMEINPANPSARKGLAALGVEVPPMEQPDTSATLSYSDLTASLGGRPTTPQAESVPAVEEQISVPLNGGSFADAVRQMQTQMTQVEDDTQSFATSPAEPLAPGTPPSTSVSDRAIMLEDFDYAGAQPEPLEPLAIAEEPMPVIETREAPARPTRRKRGKNNWLLGIIGVLLVLLLVFVLIAKFVVHAI